MKIEKESANVGVNIKEVETGESYTIGIYEKAMPGKLTWKEKLIAAKEAGYDYAEISIDETDEKLARLDMTREERNELVKLMQENSIPIRTMCLSGHRKYPMGSKEVATQKRSMEIMEKAIILADDLGIRIIQLAGYDVYYEESDEETKAIFLKNLRLAVEMAAKYGVLLAFETMETDFMNTVKKAMDYVSLVDSPYLLVYPDLGNITNAAKENKTDVKEDLESGRGHIAAVHIKETIPGKFREIPFGTGHVDFPSLIEKCYLMGVRKYVTEFWYVGSDTWKEELAETNKRFRDILNKF